MKKRYDKKRVARTAVIEIVLLVLILGGLTFFTPQITGVDKEEEIVFFKFQNAHTILIDDNPQFSSSQAINEKAVKLEPGTYYWKAVGILGESTTGTFSIDSKVILKMNKNQNGTTIENEGNVPVNVSEKRGGFLVGNMIIEPGEAFSEKDNSKEDSGEDMERDGIVEKNIIYEGRQK